MLQRIPKMHIQRNEKSVSYTCMYACTPRNMSESLIFQLWNNHTDDDDIIIIAISQRHMKYIKHKFQPLGTNFCSFQAAGIFLNVFFVCQFWSFRFNIFSVIFQPYSLNYNKCLVPSMTMMIFFCTIFIFSLFSRQSQSNFNLKILIEIFFFHHSNGKAIIKVIKKNECRERTRRG